MQMIYRKPYPRVLLLLTLLIAISLLSSCNRKVIEEVSDANSRIEDAINRIEIRADGTNAVLADFRGGSTNSYTDITVNLDFAKILVDLETEDFFRANNSAKQHMDQLYLDLAYLFTRTNDLTIIERNVDVLGDYKVPPDLENRTEFEIEIGRFIRSQNKRLRIETHYGNLDLYSDFFYGRTGLGNIDQYRLVFGYKEDADSKNATIVLAVKNRWGMEIDARYVPGKSALITIPLTAEFMRDDDGALLYNAVEYIDVDGERREVLPRSLTDDECLHIYSNRPGKFRLTKTAHGTTTDREEFLNDRGIFIQGAADYPAYVSRGQLYDSLMQIHWVENLVWPTEDAKRFPDVPVGRMADHIRIAQVMNSNFRAVGYEDGYFRPGIPIARREMFDALAGYIQAFSMEVTDLFPVRTDAISESELTAAVWWFTPYSFLYNIGFMPYKFVSGVPYIAPNDPVSIPEVYEILYKLITAGKVD